MHLLSIKIVNWNKFNPRSDRSISIWFRFENNFFEDQKLWDLTDSQRLLFIFLLCEASKKQSETIKISVSFIAHFRKKTIAQILEELKVLENLGVLHPPTGGQLVDKIPATRQDKTEQDKTNNIAQSGDFADFWSGFPRKIGKGKVAKAYLREITSGTSHEALCRARDRYRGYLEEHKTESRFIKHGSTFMNEWRDWDDPEVGKSEDFSEKPKSLDDLDLSSIFKSKVVGDE